mgnify:CR=1 FL=1|tara:strand:+ start:1668 stop:2642 length:975 start_codon:yes stop_codon:yes gene_type:complete
MNNIDCDQIILFGLVAIFAIYVYRNVLDPNQTQPFKVGAQVPVPGVNQPGVNNEMNNALNNVNNSINNLSQNLNRNSGDGVNENLMAELTRLNNGISRAEGSANAARNAANNATNAVNAASAAMNANGTPIAAANSMNAMNGSDNTDSIPAIFQNVPEPNADPGGDSVPKSYNVGKNKSDSCFPQDTLTVEDLLPQEDVDAIKQFSEESIGDGVLKGIELLGAGFHVGVNSVGQSLRNANRQLRSEPPNPQTEVSPFLNSSIGPDLQRRPLELTESCAKAQGNDSPTEVPGNETMDPDMNSVNIKNSLIDNNKDNAPPLPYNMR